MVTKQINHTRNFPSRLDYYQSCTETWAEILKLLAVDRIKTIFDICCGWSPKIELALTRTSFRGNVILIDKSRENLAILHQFIDPIGKGFTITDLPIDILHIQSRLKLSPIQADVIILNHVIDDLVVEYFSPPKNLTQTDKYYSDMNLLKSLWAKIVNQKTLQKQFLVQITNSLLSLSRKNTYILIAQYQGYQEKLYHLDTAYKLCSHITDQIGDNLIKTGKFIVRTDADALFPENKPMYFPKKDFICIQKIKN